MRDHRYETKYDGDGQPHLVEFENHRTKVKRAPKSKKYKKQSKLSRRRNRH